MTQFTIKSTLSLILGHSSMQRDDFNMSTGSPPPPPFFFSLKMRFVSHLLRLFLPGELELSQFQNIICIRLSHLHGFQRKYWNVPKETQITVFFTMITSVLFVHKSVAGPYSSVAISYTRTALSILGYKTKQKSTELSAKPLKFCNSRYKYEGSRNIQTLQ